MHYDVIIVGAGPGGLSCASKLALNGAKTLVVERNQVIGTKVCAGGITWSGLIEIIPEELIERSFPRQHISTRFQKICVEAQHPIIATVNRKKLGQYMAEVAVQNDATIWSSTSLKAIEGNTIQLLNHKNNQLHTSTYDFLVGADGSSSLVRKHLGLPFDKVGLGINFQVEGDYEKMEWHLNSHFFKNGYGWIFPHKDSISIGAYVNRNVLSAQKLKKSLIAWAKASSFDLSKKRCSAGLVNYDFQGWQFDNIFLIGDAAGFASALTGEGIYPAIISGEQVAEKIIDPTCDLTRLERLEKKQKRFARMVDLTSKNSLLSSLLSEIGGLALRTKLIDFTMLEMGK